MGNKTLIYTNEARLSLQISYNNDWAKAVNQSIEELKKVTGELSDDRLRKYISSPTTFCAELVEAAKKEYEAYMANLPKSVRLSSTFSDGGLTNAVKALHNELLRKKPSQIIDKTTIKNGQCLLEEEGKEELKRECSIYGGEQAAKVWRLTQKASKALNELQMEIQGNSAFADAVECWGRWQGFITIQDSKTERYQPNPNLLNTLLSERE